MAEFSTSITENGPFVDEFGAEIQWRVFYTRPRAEMKIEQRLLHQGVDVFLPKRTAFRVWSDRKKKIIEPLFRNYLFARVSEQSRFSVLNDDGVVYCVRQGKDPATVSNREIERLKKTQRDPSRLGLVDLPKLQKGENVRIHYGVFSGLECEVLNMKGVDQVILRVDSMSTSVRIHIPLDWVSTVSVPKM